MAGKKNKKKNERQNLQKLCQLCFGNKKKNNCESRLAQFVQSEDLFSNHRITRQDSLTQGRQSSPRCRLLAEATLTLPDPAELGEGKNSAPTSSKKIWCKSEILGKCFLLRILNPRNQKAKTGPSASVIYSWNVWEVQSRLEERKKAASLPTAT